MGGLCSAVNISALRAPPPPTHPETSSERSCLPAVGTSGLHCCLCRAHIWVHTVRRNHGNPTCRYPPSGSGCDGAEKTPLPTHQFFWKPAQTDSSWLPLGEDHRWLPSPSKRKTDGSGGPADRTEGLPHQSLPAPQTQSYVTEVPLRDVKDR